MDGGDMSMQSFGIISLDNESEKNYIDGIAKFAHEYDFQLYRFTPDDIELENEKITGFKFNSKTSIWERKTFTIPTILYDRTFYRDEIEAKKYSRILNPLKASSKFHFLGYGLPNKLKMYEMLKHNERIRPYLPYSKQVNDAGFVIDYLSNHQKILLKPVFGSQGRGIFVIQKQGHLYDIQTVKSQSLIIKTFTEKRLNQWLQMLIANYPYLLQPYLSLKDEKEHPFDIRILLQKNETGKWSVRGKAIRVGQKNSILSNLAAGGIPKTFDSWFKKQTAEKKVFIQESINEIINTVPTLLETIFHPLFEIGIDIGVDQKGAVWILETNSKPGRNVFLTLQPEITETFFRAPLAYGKYIISSPKKGMVNDEQVLSN
jgi:glutathione synthase/RimK-type ligase-like ATP-grasp enzyme